MRRIFSILAATLLAPALLGFAPPDPNGERTAHPPIHVRDGATATYQTGYQPSQIRHAYGFDQLTATGQNRPIAIVDAYGSPTIQKDLATFNSQFGLPAANLTIAYPQGKPNKVDSGWALETSLDVEWAHALTPNAPILLVVAKTNSFNNLLAAVDYANTHGAAVVSMSWGGSEFSSEASYDYHFTHAGVVYTASAGDNGSGVLWPAASPNVVAVGGTSLPLDAGGNLTGPETAWSGSGGGISGYESEPGYQTSYGIVSNNRRGSPDISFDADPNTGVAVYDSTKYYGQVGWFVVGGTSFGSPSWAALVALADQGRTSSLTDGHAALYQMATGSSYSTDYRDVTGGSNGNPARTGYDFVTGLGSPLAASLVQALTQY